MVKGGVDVDEVGVLIEGFVDLGVGGGVVVFGLEIVGVLDGDGD